VSLILAVVLGIAVVAVTGPPVGASPTGTVTGPDTVAQVSQVTFATTRVGAVSDLVEIELTNQGDATDTVTGLDIAGADPGDFYGDTDCLTDLGGASTLAAGASCTLFLEFVPAGVGTRTATVTVVDAGPAAVIDVSGNGTEGYWEATAGGGVYPFGDAGNDGDMSRSGLNAPIVGVQASFDGGGYYLLGADGGVFTFGDAAFYGSTGSLQLNKPVIGMAPTSDGDGYWLVASDGGVFAYGDAVFDGSTGSLHLNEPIVGMAATPDGGGYWLVASDGGIFAFGDAGFYGSTGSLHLNEPIVGMAATPDGGGYWLVASDGGIFTFGDAGFHGSAGSLPLAGPIVGMAATATGDGYWLTDSHGGILTGGDAPYLGGLGGTGTDDVVGITADAPPAYVGYATSSSVRHRSLPGPRPGWAPVGG